MLRGRRILLAVTGSIAAYKSAFLARELVKAGAELQVLMTRGATRFVSPLTFSTLSRNPVLTDSISDEERGEWTDHVYWGRWPDRILIAPATANSIARLAHGMAEELLELVYLSAECPVDIAPAMDLEMHRHPATRANLERIAEQGVRIIPAREGELASGLKGVGRMEEPERILEELERRFQKEGSWQGKRVLITAGPTHEPIDPVRFIGNHSSGRMGVALAETAAARGADVTLVLGPGSVRPQEPSIECVDVDTAEAMFKACETRFPEMDLAIMAAAVADHRPASVSPDKIKKGSGAPEPIALEPTVDILASLGKVKKEGQLLIGFALESDEGGAEAQRKLKAKNADLIVLNSLQEEGSGFQHETNAVTLYSKDNDPERIPLDLKSHIAERILDRAERCFS